MSSRTAASASTAPESCTEDQQMKSDLASTLQPYAGPVTHCKRIAIMKRVAMRPDHQHQEHLQMQCPCQPEAVIQPCSQERALTMATPHACHLLPSHRKGYPARSSLTCIRVARTRLELAGQYMSSPVTTCWLLRRIAGVLAVHQEDGICVPASRVTCALYSAHR